MGRLGRKHQITVWTGRKLLPYALDRLTWNPQHTRNEQNVYCYCGGHRETPCVQCHSCQQWFHTDCMKVGVIAPRTRTRAYRWRKLRPHLPTSFPLDRREVYYSAAVMTCTQVLEGQEQSVLPFQRNCQFCCSVCGFGGEEFKLTSVTWLQSILGAFCHMMWLTHREEGPDMPPSFVWAVLTEVRLYICRACSCQEVLRVVTARQATASRCPRLRITWRCGRCAGDTCGVRRCFCFGWCLSVSHPVLASH
jgi:hypothetical protein